MSFWKSDWEIVAVVFILSSCAVAQSAISGKTSTSCVAAGGKWHDRGCDPGFCERVGK
jgi:hypothetical protein